MHQLISDDALLHWARRIADIRSSGSFYVTCSGIGAYVFKDPKAQGLKLLVYVLKIDCPLHCTEMKMT